MIARHIFEGGYYFMIPIVTIWVIVFIIAITGFIRYFSGTEPTKLRKNNNLVLFLGSFAFLYGLLGQIIGLLAAFKAIEAAYDISPAIIAGGLRVSFLAPVYGFVIFIISLIVWFINRNYLLNK